MFTTPGANWTTVFLAWGELDHHFFPGANWTTVFFTLVETELNLTREEQR